MRLEISFWTSHLNQILYSYFYFCRKNKLAINIRYNVNINHGGALLYIDNKKVFFDYSDDIKFLDKAENYSFYFKRSLLEEDRKNNILPLNFNLTMSYKSHLFLFKLDRNILFNKFNKVEVARAIDFLGLFTNSSHSIVDVRKYPQKVKDYGGNVIFNTRVWNPDNHPDKEEKERRIKQNEFRINACRIIKKEYKNASVGLFGEELSNRLAPDLVLPNDKSNKKKYLKELGRYNIGIADDGLKNTPGWKIGEYLLYGKAVISTPLSVCTDNFKEHVNYEKLSSRSSYQDIPEKIEYLIKDKKYLEMGENNMEWSGRYLHPDNYFNRILELIKE
jgi:hypothetical protein